MATAAHDERRLGLIFERQWLHALGLIVLLAGCWWAAQWLVWTRG